MESTRGDDSFYLRSNGEKIIPEVYFPESEYKGVGTAQGHATAAGIEGLEGSPSAWTGNADLQTEVDVDLEGGDGKKDLGPGFFPIGDLKEEDLPEEIRCEEVLDLIRSTAKRVVCIVNNTMSDKRPDKFKFDGQRSMKGTGFLLRANQNYAIVSTNRHVLYNNEEIRKATLYLDYNEPMVIDGKMNEDIKIVKRGKGLGVFRGNQTEDFTLAVFSMNEKVRITALKMLITKEKMPTLMFHIKTTNRIPDKRTFPKIVCVISHPLGQPKQVSFGRVLKESLDTGEYEHDAPTHSGSSGAPLLIFSRAPPEVPPGSIWYHIGKFQKHPGVKMARLQVNDSELFDLNVEFVGKADLLSVSQRMSGVVAEKIKNYTHFIRLMSSWTCFGGAVLQPERFLSKLDEHPLTTCKELVFFLEKTRDKKEEDVAAILSECPKLMVEDFCQVMMQKLQRSSKSKITDVDDDIFYQSVLTSSDLCTCNALLRLVTAEDHSKNKITDTSYLCPDSFPLCPWQHNTWPFGLQDLRQATSPAVDRRCIRWNSAFETTKRSLLDIASNDVWKEDENNVKEMLHTLMICRVAENLLSGMKKTFPTQTDMGTQERIKTTTQHHTSTQTSIDESLTERRHECLELILGSLEEFLKELDVDGAILVVMCSNYLNSEASDQAQPAPDSQSEAERGVQPKTDILSGSDDDEVTCERVPHSHISKKEAEDAALLKAISQALDNRHQAACEELRTLVSHVLQHCRQDHKDGVDHQGERCECGRPSVKGLMKAVKHIRSLHRTDGNKNPTSTERTQVGIEENSASIVYRKEMAGKESKTGSRNCNYNSDDGTHGTEKDCPSCGYPSEVTNVRESLASRVKTNTVHKSSTAGSRDSRENSDARTEHDSYIEYMDVRAGNTRRHTRTQSDPNDEYIQVHDRNTVEDPAPTESSRDDEYISMLTMKDWEDSKCIESDTQSDTSVDECNKVSVSDMTEVNAKLDADNCHHRKLLSQSTFCFLFHLQFGEDESQNWEEEKEGATRKLQGLILLLRRFFMATEVFLYNCQQFLSSFHDVLGCSCDVVRSAARASPPDNVHGDDAVPTQAGTASQERGQGQDPDILSMEAMEVFVSTQGKLPTPVETVGSSESCLQESDTKSDDRMYTAFEEAQMALLKVVEKSLDQVFMNFWTEKCTITCFAFMSTPLIVFYLLVSLFGYGVFGIESEHLDHLQLDSRQEVQCNDEDDASPPSESFWLKISYRLAKKVFQWVLDSGESCVEGRDSRVTLPVLQRAAEHHCLLQFAEMQESESVILEIVVAAVDCLEMLATTSTSGVQTSVFSNLSPNLRRQIMQRAIDNKDKVYPISLPFFNFVMEELAVAESLADSATEDCLEKATVSCLEPAGADFQHIHTTSLTALEQAALLCNSTSQAAERGESSDEDDEAATEPDEEYIYVRAGNKGGNHTRAKSNSENEHTHVRARSFMKDHTRTEKPVTHVHEEPQQFIAKGNCSSAHKNGAGVNTADGDLCRPPTSVPRNQQPDQDDIVPDSGQRNSCCCTLLSYISSSLLCWCRRSF